MISLLVVAAALGGTITGLFFAGIRWLLVVLIAALAAGSVLAARHALRRTDQALRADAARLARARPPEHPVLIMNPRSGGGKVERFQLVVECRKRGIEPILLEPGDDLRELAEDAVAAARTCWAWRAGMARRRWSPRSRPGPAWTTCAFRPAPATTSPSTWAWTGPTWWGRSMPTRTRWNSTSTWPR